MEKRGQVSIFIIVAIVIVGIIVLLFLFPKVTVSSNEVNPSSYLKNCIEPAVSEIKIILSAQGGYAVPTNYLMYQGNKIQYLCYTSENYIPCSVQQPLLVKHIAEEMRAYIQPRARQCVQDLRKQYEQNGYTVQATPGEINISIATGSIVVDFISPMVISKEQNTQTYQRFAVAIDSSWYDLLSTATNIIEYESSLGDSDTNAYISYYPNLKIVKTRRDEGTVYALTDVTTKDTFTFASRSLVWPPGFT